MNPHGVVIKEGLVEIYAQLDDGIDVTALLDLLKESGFPSDGTDLPQVGDETPPLACRRRVW
jgi:hypothetical protein